MMKKLLSCLCAGLLAVALAGCGGGGENYDVDPSILTDKLNDAPSKVQPDIDQAVAALKTGDFAATFKSLTRVAKGMNMAQMPPDNPHKKEMINLLIQMQKVMSTETDKASQEAYDAMREFSAAIDPSLKTDPNAGLPPPPDQR